MMEWVDTHCHLDEESFTQDCAEAIQRAVDAGVKTMLAIGITLDSCRRVIDLSQRYPSVYAVVGLHPNYVSAAQPGDWDRIVELAKAPKVVGLGETGLDKYWDHSPIELQAEYFDRHLELSRYLDLPFVVHCREAESETVAQLRRQFERGGPLRGVMHAFCGTPETAQACLDMGMYLSFGGMVTFKKNENLRQLSTLPPLDRILVETDAPYLAPTPFRGKRNEPAHVRLTAACLAEARGVSKEVLAAATTENARRLFCLPSVGQSPRRMTVDESRIRPNTFVDVTDDWPRAIEWLGRLMAIQANKPYDPKQLVGAQRGKEALARYRGQSCGVKYAEAVCSTRAYPSDVFQLCSGRRTDKLLVGALSQFPKSTAVYEPPLH